MNAAGKMRKNSASGQRPLAPYGSELLRGLRALLFKLKDAVLKVGHLTLQNLHFLCDATACSVGAARRTTRRAAATSGSASAAACRCVAYEPYGENNET